MESELRGQLRQTGDTQGAVITQGLALATTSRKGNKSTADSCVWFTQLRIAQ